MQVVQLVAQKFTSVTWPLRSAVVFLEPSSRTNVVFGAADDCVAKKKPNREIYELAKQSLGLPVDECVVIEDSRNGLLDAKGAGLPTLITTSTYTVDEDFSEADRVVPELGDAPTINVTLADLGELAAQHAPA